ncbi:heptose-I-phosphate ethanolaminephosphotransferase [Methylobacillus rhizosphaerae]|uniref:Heptose-I-phosphate ethanolaminephosphotransferase n=1 Tax=Methylobacillus rhizosphaerae TaxID=551994 RepID=A0A239AG78_9PROT|nr:phosphoethanolamine transferase CptA [Methylobacillus rhizosphaerae]SNR94647.1 heptose-I-phosphate ethanolaminephosphotransferase [Methylobacillus rhizosphaerae]
MQTPFKLSLQRPGWSAVLDYYLFFFYFSGITHILLQISGATIFVGLRQAIVMSLLWLIPVMLLPRYARKLAAGIGLVLWGFSLVSLGYFCIYGQEFSQSVMFTIFESNPAESSEFIAHYFVWWMIPVLLLHSAVAYWLWHRLGRVQVSRRAAWTVSLLILTLLFVQPMFKQLVIKRAGLDTAVEKLQLRMEPAVPWQMVIGYMHYRKQLANMEALLEQNNKVPPLNALQDTNAGQPATLVLVLGESTNRERMSLYGYPRKTTPRLDAMREQLSVFENVVTSRPYTIESLTQVLSFADQEHPDLYLTKPSLMNMMRQADYKSYWITNHQTITKRNTMLTNFSKQTDRQFYMNNSRAQNSREYDANVFAPFEEVLADPAPRKFIVVHLLGTHMKYEYRYPAEFNVFRGRAGVPSVLDDDEAEVYNSYDNAVLYNDYVMSTLINTLRERAPNSLLVYFSDHGEDVYDGPDHDMLGRNESKPTLPMYTVPFIIWASEQWKSHHDMNFESMLQRPYSNAHFIYTWADLAGLSFDGFDPQFSLINSQFKEHPLLIGNPNQPDTLHILDLHDH